MANRLIPRKTKVQLEIFRGFTILDILYVILCGLVFLAIFYSNIPYNMYIAIVVTLFMLAMIIKTNGIRLYVNVSYAFRFLAFKKIYSNETKGKKVKGNNIKDLIPYTKIDGQFIDYGTYRASVIEITPIEFWLLNEYKQEMIINSFANALRRLTDAQTGSIYKISKAMVLDDYIRTEQKKYDAVDANYERGLYTDEEMEARENVFESRVNLLENFNYENKINKDYFYFVVYDKDRETLQTTIEGAAQVIAGGCGAQTKVLQGAELAVFLRSTYDSNFDERETEFLSGSQLTDWSMPEKVRFKAGSTVINDTQYSHFSIVDYPMSVGNAWGTPFFNFDNSVVCVNFKLMGKMAAEKMIDNTILEMEGQLAKTFKSSQKIEKENVIETIKQLLVDLKNQNESLFNVNFHIVCESKTKKEVRAKIKETGFKYNEMFGRQTDAFISRSVSARDNIKEAKRGMQTTTLAGLFPFISSALQDDGGLYIGYNKYPVFVDFFKRNHERVNSNMIVIGKSGSGKSFATKLLLAHLAADDGKVFVCDPENEYENLTRNMGGKIIDVGSGLKARFNPLHIMSSLEDEAGEDSDSFSMHLQFLEEFFKIILEGISPDALETLNRIVVDLYSYKGISSRTDLSQLTPEHFPTFDDLYELTQEKLDEAADDYMRVNYKIVLNYIAKFATGGRSAGLWNGPTNINTSENFCVFNFRSLLANRNQNITRAQMLLTFKYLDNEIIKNREYNLKHGTKRKIVVAVDEAHVFINPKYPIALDFMFQMAKRIRKYNGMQIILTQNIRDFMGSEDMIRQSSAIIAASQYSMIFSLAPNDVTELVKLYKNAGEINESEQDQIATAGRGYCFFISGPMSRTSFQIEAMDDIKQIME